MTTLGSSFISGITTTSFNSTDVVNKDYVDNYVAVPSQTGNAGKFLTTTDGTSTSWDFVSNTQEFTTTGISTFNVPSYSNLLYIEAVGAGGGGNAGQTREQAAVTWTLRTSGTGIIRDIIYGNNIYIVAGDSGTLKTSTDTIIWTLRTAGSSTGLISGVFVSGPTNSYVIGGASGYLITSTDAIAWTSRTSGATNSINAFTFGNNTYVIGGSGFLNTSTDAIIWTLRTSGFGGNQILTLSFGNNLYLAGASASLSTSTDSIIWTLRTISSNTFVTGIIYVNNLYTFVGYSPTDIRTSTNAIVWEARTSGTTENLYNITYGGIYVAGSLSGGIISSTNTITWTLRTFGTTTGSSVNALNYANNIFITGHQDASIRTSYSQASGAGGGAGSYTSWYIPKSIVSSNLTVNPGVGGAGAITDAGTGSAGAGTTISWTGPGGTYILTASGGSGTAVGAAQLTSQSSSFYTTAGLTGAPPSPIGSGFTATTQTNQFQPTGGGSGAGSTESSGGSGGTINVYGISTSASGGDNTGTNGTNAVVISGLPYGYGGGGGGASVSVAATGGNGSRGGGGGGGASIGSTFGNGGNGGDGYVKISWW